jgi:hypothetical protein
MEASTSVGASQGGQPTTPKPFVLSQGKKKKKKKANLLDTPPIKLYCTSGHKETVILFYFNFFLVCALAYVRIFTSETMLLHPWLQKDMLPYKKRVIIMSSCLWIATVMGQSTLTPTPSLFKSSTAMASTMSRIQHFQRTTHL